MARTSGLANLTTQQLTAELARRQKTLPRLLKKQAKLEKQLATVNGQIADLSGETTPAGTVAKKAKKLVAKRKAGRKPPREGSLKALLVAAMVGKKGLSVSEAMEAAQAAGYKSQSKNFRLLVNQTLLNQPEFKKVKRGIFTVKGQPAAEKATKAGRKPGRKRKEAGKPGPKPKTRAGRSRKGKPLAAFVQEALTAAGKGITVREIEKAVLAAGYVTKGKNLYNPIGAVLGKIGAKKVARGVYAVAKKPGRKPGKKAAPAAEAAKA